MSIPKIERSFNIIFDLTAIIKWTVVYLIISKIISNAEQLGKLFH